MSFSIDFLYKVNNKILYIRENFVKRHKLSFTTGAKCDIIKMLGQTDMFACFCRKREVWLVKDRKPVYTEEYASYFPYAESTVSLKIFTVMIDVFYFWLAMECLAAGATVLCVASLLLTVVVTVTIIMLILWMENAKITVSHDGAVFENTLTGKTKSFAWADVAAVEYIAYEHSKKTPGYKIYLRKDGAETTASSKKPRYPDYYLGDANVDRHKLAAFIPQGLHVVEK